MLVIDDYTIKNIILEFGSNSAYIILFCIAVVYVFFMNRRDKQHDLRDNGSNVFVFYSLLLALTVFNPLIADFLLSHISALKITYYRYFWIVPIICVMAYAATDLVFRWKQKILQIVFAIVLVFVIGISGSPALGNEYFYLPDNMYKIPEELLEILDMIQEDSLDDEPIVIFPEKYANQVRQYDASIHLPYGRALYMGHSTTSDRKYNLYMKYINDTLYNHTREIEERKLNTALIHSDADYVVLPQQSNGIPFMENVGYSPIYTMGSYTVYARNK